MGIDVSSFGKNLIISQITYDYTFDDVQSIHKNISNLESFGL